MGFFDRLKQGLTRTRSGIVENLNNVFAAYEEIDDEFFEDLEEVMVSGDIGVRTTEEILDDLHEKVAQNKVKNPAQCKKVLMNSIKDAMRTYEADYEFENRKSVILVIGVNGVGKTTSVGKLASLYRLQNKRVIIAAADTYRAAANEQLAEWANRAGVQLISGQDGADPGSVVYDAVAAAKARNAEMLIIDTAGRLHNKKNLMNELHKIYSILEKTWPEAYQETLLVLDGATGQNALSQAKEFAEVTNVSGIILTKLDGTPRGGIAVAIQSELAIPVKFIGVGERIDDLQKFNADDFVDALFDAAPEKEEQ